MALEFIKHTELKDKLAKEGSTVVNVYADWCGPCKMLAPILKEVSEKHTVLKINADQNQDFIREMGIQGIPVTYIYKNGKPAKKLEGFIPKEAIEAAL